MSLKTVLEIQKKKNYKRRELREDLYKKIKNRIDYYARFGKTLLAKTSQSPLGSLQRHGSH